MRLIVVGLPTHVNTYVRGLMRYNYGLANMRVEDVMRIMYVPERGHARTELSQEQLPTVLQEKRGLLWVDLDAEEIESAEHILSDIFAFHPLAVDDAINEVHLPKVDDWHDYLYLVLRGLEYEEQEYAIRMPELDIFLGARYLVTFHHEPIATVDYVWQVLSRDERLQRNGPAYLLYRLVDELVDHYITTVERVEDSLETIETEVLLRPSTGTQERILALKHTVLQLRRVTALQREVLNRLARDPFAVIDAEARFYFRDVYDHMVRLFELIDGVRDLVMGALDLYLAAINNRMNEVMRTLTVITTLFMPLSFITGFFGMNFFQPVLGSLDVWTGGIVFSLVLMLMLLVPVGMFLWMRRRAWM